MRLVRYRSSAVVRLGALADGGEKVIDLRAAVADYLRSQGDPFADREAALRVPYDTAEFLRRGPISTKLVRSALAHLQSSHPGPGVMHARNELRLEAPLVPPLIVCGGANFWDHLRELGRDKPQHVEFFLKNSSKVLGLEDDIPYQPWASEKLDYEVELGIVIGRPAYRVRAAEALDYVFGYTVVNDMAIRDRQLFRFGERVFHVKYGNGKVFDFNSAIGPAIVSVDEIADPMNLAMKTCVDGEVRQESNTSGYIWGVREVVEYYSSMITLEPGFVICPGTPGGCAVGSDPECGGRHQPRHPSGEYLRPGQTVVVEVAGIGRLENRIRRAELDEFATGGTCK